MDALSLNISSDAGAIFKAPVVPYLVVFPTVKKFFQLGQFFLHVIPKFVLKVYVTRDKPDIHRVPPNPRYLQGRHSSDFTIEGAAKQ